MVVHRRCVLLSGCLQVKVINTEPDTAGSRPKGGQRTQCLFLLYIEAVSVLNSRGARPRPLASPPSPKKARCDDATSLQLRSLSLPSAIQDFSARDLEFVVRFTQEYRGEQFRHLVRALCPSIYGHEMVKAGILLALLGGVRKHVSDPLRVPVRGDVHVLVVGDPGLGKSQLLQVREFGWGSDVRQCALVEGWTDQFESLHSGLIR